jgi:putative intracellular protease/amidase
LFLIFSDWEPGYAIAGINNPAFQARPGIYSVSTVGLTKDPVISLGGITILPDMTLDELEAAQSAMLILPGGATWDERKNTEAVAKAAAFLDANVPVAAICGATAGLARTGILDESRHTSNSLDYVKATGYRGEALQEFKKGVEYVSTYCSPRNRAIPKRRHPHRDGQTTTKRDSKERVCLAEFL